MTDKNWSAEFVNNFPPHADDYIYSVKKHGVLNNVNKTFNETYAYPVGIRKKVVQFDLVPVIFYLRSTVTYK